MKTTLAVSGSLLGLSFLFSGYSCSSFSGGVSTTAAVIAQIVSHSPQACNDLLALGADGQAIANQVAAANPNSPTIQHAAAAVNSGTTTVNSSCQQLAASFRAEAPSQLLNKHVYIDRGVLERIK